LHEIPTHSTGGSIIELLNQEGFMIRLGIMSKLAGIRENCQVEFIL